MPRGQRLRRQRRAFPDAIPRPGTTTTWMCQDRDPNPTSSQTADNRHSSNFGYRTGWVHPEVLRGAAKQPRQPARTEVIRVKDDAPNLYPTTSGTAKNTISRPHPATRAEATQATRPCGRLPAIRTGEMEKVTPPGIYKRERPTKAQP